MASSLEKETSTPSPIMATASSQKVASTKKMTNGHGKGRPEQMQCEECKLDLKTEFNRNFHFGQGLGVPRDNENVCQVCHLSCPTRCSLSAHERLHTPNSAPLVCPECGKHLTCSWPVFIKHVKDLCLHFARAVGVLCISCKAFQSSIEDVVEHVFSVHVEKYCKCGACPRAFKSLEMWEEHWQAKHQDNKNPSKNMMYKCPLCDWCAKHDKQLKIHLTSHITNKHSQEQYLFKCRHCSVVCDSKLELKRHLADVHTEHSVIAMCHKCGDVFRNSKEKWSHKRVACGDNIVQQTGSKTTRFRKILPKLTNPFPADVPDTQAKVTNVGSAGILKCQICGEELESQAAMLVHAQTHIQACVHVCVSCNCLSFSSLGQLASHFLQCESMKHTPQPCVKLCGELFNDGKKLIDHMKEKHDINPFACTMCDAQFLDETSLEKHIGLAHSEDRKKYVCRQCHLRGFSKLKLLQTHLQHEHGMSNAEMTQSGLASPSVAASNKLGITFGTHADSGTGTGDTKSLESCLVSDNKMAAAEGHSHLDEKQLHVVGGDSHFICAKCDFRSKNRKLFKEHIRTHFQSGSEQCEDCGRCFLSRSSLKKHQVIVHSMSSGTRSHLTNGHLINTPNRIVNSQIDRRPTGPSN